jgi:predicted DNA-binding transcriptional regulator AlpA
MPVSMLRRPQVESRVGKGKSWLYEKIAAGTFTRPVKVDNSSLWPDYEVDDIVDALIASATEEELRALVAQLHTARKSWRKTA